MGGIGGGIGGGLGAGRGTGWVGGIGGSIEAIGMAAPIDEGDSKTMQTTFHVHCLVAGRRVQFLMADPRKMVAENVPGDFFVDTTCIDCDTCRQLAPQVYGQARDYSYVRRQPAGEVETRQALQALLACPTGSIGTSGGQNAKLAAGDFPLLVEEPVYYCGYTSPASFGGSSYFFPHPGGNWLVDSPKFLPPLVRKFEAWGGIAHIFLTHEDDVADAAKYARHFGSRRHIHRLELAAQPDAEVVLDGTAAIRLADDLVAIPTPGHTAGHCALLLQDRFLFTGDHLWWDRDEQRLGASRDYCWHSWSEQVASLKLLLSYRFEWVLPGHGQRVKLPAEEMREQLARLVRRYGDWADEPVR